MSGTLKIGGKTLATHDTSSNKLAFHSDANDTGQLCRAWVNFNGTLAMTVGSSYGPDAPPADYSSPNPIRASFNVESITDNGTGDYTVNFATAMPDANYSIAGMVSNTVNDWTSESIGSVRGPIGIYQNGTTQPSTTACRVETAYGSHASINSNGANYDFSQVTISIFR